MAFMSLRVPDELAARLAALAGETGRTKTYVALQALQRFVDQEAWQVAEIQQGLREADAGDFATDEEMAALDAKWTRHAE